MGAFADCTTSRSDAAWIFIMMRHLDAPGKSVGRNGVQIRKIRPAGGRLAVDNSRVKLLRYNQKLISGSICDIFNPR
jgi:hypothetical protein